jgi:hypothetical protein
MHPIPFHSIELNAYIVLNEPYSIRTSRSTFPTPFIPLFHPLCGSLSLSTPQLSRLILFDRLLALADGARAGNGVFAEIWAVVALGCAVDDALVGAASSTAATDGGLLDLSCRGVLLVGLLGQESDTTVLSG